MMTRWYNLTTNCKTHVVLSLNFQIVLLCEMLIFMVILLVLHDYVFFYTPDIDNYQFYSPPAQYSVQTWKKNYRS